ncbi:MAG TPA: hypothetical protein VGF69_24050 [Thermoanaerobaculia bacterium]|jgi:hypothetical protein
MESTSGSSTVATIRSRIISSPEIVVVPTARLIPTENLDPTRAATVRRTLIKDGGIRQPIQVAWRDGRWLVLDGHNRLSAFASLGLRYVLVQVHRGPIGVRTWVLGAKADKLPVSAHLEVVDEPAFAKLVDTRGGLVTKAGAHAVFPQHPHARIEAQHALVNTLATMNRGDELARYKDMGRESIAWWPRVAESDADIHTLLIYPQTTFADFSAMVAAGLKMPAGATRFLLQKVLLSEPIPLGLFGKVHSIDESRAQVAAAMIQRSTAVEVSQ